MSRNKNNLTSTYVADLPGIPDVKELPLKLPETSSSVFSLFSSSSSNLTSSPTLTLKALKAISFSDLVSSYSSTLTFTTPSSSVFTTPSSSLLPSPSFHTLKTISSFSDLCSSSSSNLTSFTNPSSSSLLPSPRYPGPTHKLRQGDLKRVFQGQRTSIHLDMQIITKIMEEWNGLLANKLVISDSGEYTQYWGVSDSTLVRLAETGLQPLIRITNYSVNLNKPSLDIISYEVIDNTKEVVGQPQLIQLPFFINLRNLAKTPSPLVSQVTYVSAHMHDGP